MEAKQIDSEQVLTNRLWLCTGIFQAFKRPSRPEKDAVFVEFCYVALTRSK